jgi:hypothetical protein
MILISHRGNLNGPNKNFENRPEYINYALSKGFNVEVDVKIYKNKIFLGHNKPQYKINSTFLLNKKIWCPATVGVHYWKKGMYYVKYAEQMIKKNIRVNNEFYVCPVFNEAIQDKKNLNLKS